MKPHALLLLSFAALASACSDPDSPADAATTDVTADVISDTSADVTSDVTSDTSTDVTLDAPADVASDVVVDAPADAARDVSDATVDVADSATPDAAADASGDAPCTRPDVVVIGSRVSCATEACPSGYTCMTFSGIVAQRFCGRACLTDCDCPATQSCGSYTDKAGTHPICVSP